MLSKMARPQPDLLTDLTKCKLLELKDIVRELKLRVSGTKIDLINRILNFRQEQKSAIKIQQASRGWFVRELFKIKGKLAPKLCVNEADFYTLDPLNEIPFSEYIEHRDSTGVQYGFHMRSLYHLLSKMKKFDNPYTREDMKPTFGARFIRAMRLTSIVFPENKILSKDDDVEICAQVNAGIDSLTRRTNELFMKIDALGHYSNIEWFNRLSNNEIGAFVGFLFTIWCSIPRDLRYNIYNLGNPFAFAENINMRDQTLNENRDIAIRIGESLISSNAAEEYRNLSAMYFLTAMTLVSRAARNQMPWLYENYFVIIHNRA